MTNEKPIEMCKDRRLYKRKGNNLMTERRGFNGVLDQPIVNEKITITSEIIVRTRQSPPSQ